MKLFTKKAALVLLAAPLAFGSVSVMAADHGAMPKKEMHMKHHDGMKMDRGLWKQLDLTDAQKDQLKELRKQQRASMKEGFKAHKEEMKADRAQLDALVMADSFDQAAAQSLAQKMADQSVEGRVAMLKARHDMMSVLTAEQKEKLQQLKQERHEKMQKRMQERKQDMK